MPTAGTLAGGLTKALKDPTNTAAYPTQVQNSLEQQITNTTAACAKVPTPLRC